jgi:cysteine-rich repeat protein
MRRETALFLVLLLPASCTPIVGSILKEMGNCGNHMVDPGEECDDGNSVSGDGCSASCRIEPPPHCGDMNVDYLEGEECDDGNTQDGDRCSSLCRIEAPPTCGDDALDIALGEECDDGNLDAGDGCSPACQFEHVGTDCGNSRVDPGEVCDDGNRLNGDGCNPTCNMQNRTSPFVGSPGQQGLQDGTGPNALLGGYGTLAVDERYVYFGDANNCVIRRIEVETAGVQTIAGDAAAGACGYLDHTTGNMARFAGIEAIATDGSTLWVADGANRRIRAVDLTPPFGVTTLAGSGNQAYTDGTGTAAEFEDIRGLTFYSGLIYLLDGTAYTLRQLDLVTAEVSTLAGYPHQTGQVDGFGSAARFVSPRYMASDNSGILFIADTNGNQIRTYNTFTTFVGTFAGDGTQGYLDGTGTLAQVHRPRGMVTDGTSLYWVEFNMFTIRQAIIATAAVTTMVGTVGTPGYVEGTGIAAQMNNPFSITYHFPTNSLFFVDSNNYVIRRIQ